MKYVLLIFLFLFLSLCYCYRQEKIISAEKVKRVSTNTILQKMDIEHYGIRIKTNLGNTYLIHNVPKTGMVVTKAPMSSEWKVVEKIIVRGDKTIGGALEQGSGVTNIGIINYLTSATCIGTANNVKKYLQK